MMKYFGVLGELAQENGRAQCHICGKWFLNLGCHVVKKHKISKAEYCDSFMILRTTPLAGTEFREQCRERESDRLRYYAKQDWVQKKKLAAQTGELNSSKRPDVRAAISRQSKKPHTRKAVALGIRKPSVRKKLSEAAKGRRPSEEAKAKMSATRRRLNLELGDTHWSKRPENRERFRKLMNSPEVIAKRQETFKRKKANKRNRS